MIKFLVDKGHSESMARKVMTTNDSTASILTLVTISIFVLVGWWVMRIIIKGMKHGMGGDNQLEEESITVDVKKTTENEWVIQATGN